MSTTEWLEDRVQVCSGRHMVHEPLGLVHFAGGAYVKMCRACYEQEYPDYNFDELEKC